MRLVLADNDPVVIELLELDLTLEGHTILASARDGETAIEACARLAPDALVVDYRMPPGPNGLDVIEAVHAERPDVVCLLFTNYSAAKVRARAEELNAVYVPKSTLAELRTALAAAAAQIS